ncbi:MAG: hypothetical protein ACYTFE_05665, partial [Planctomycetota bacterium]
MKTTKKMLFMVFLLFVVVQNVQAEKVLTIYCCGTGATEAWYNASASAFDSPELIATLYHFDDSNENLTNESSTHYKTIVDGIGSGSGFALFELLSQINPDWGARPWSACMSEATGALNDVLDNNNPDPNVILNLLGWSRGGILTMKIARWIANQPENKNIKERVTKINILAFDPVPGMTDPVGVLGNEVVFPTKVNQYVGIYSQDERSWKFEPMKPDYEDLNATKKWLIRVRGSHETLVGSTQLDGHAISTTPLPPDLDWPIKIPEIHAPGLVPIGNLSKAIAQELLSSSEWGNVQFDPNSLWHQPGDKRTQFIQLIDSMYAYPEIGYVPMHTFATSPFHGTFSMLFWPFSFDKYSMPSTLGVLLLHGRLCFVAPRRSGFILNHELVYWLNNEVAAINRDNAWETLQWLCGAIGGGVPPTANAGRDVVIASHMQDETILYGSASDPDQDELQYRWLDGQTELSSWQTVVDSNAHLDLSTVYIFPLGDYILTLEVSDGLNITTDEMTLSVVLPPVADAGPDQTVYADVNGLTRVWLDGTGSYDPDGDPLRYFWYEDSNDVNTGYDDPNELIATGPEPNVVLPVGKHVIHLIVHDGLVSSEPNDVVITVIEPLESEMKFTPQTLNQ